MAKKLMCTYCEMEIITNDHRPRSDIRFHDDTCRSNYHNERKRIKRLKTNAEFAISQLLSIRATANRHNRAYATYRLDEIQRNIAEWSGTGYICMDCENFIETNTAPRKCAKCGGLEFIGKPALI